MNAELSKIATLYRQSGCIYVNLLPVERNEICPLAVEMSEREYPYSPQLSFEVIMREAAITAPKNNKPILYTRGIWSCLGLTGYSKEAKVGFLAHITATTDIQKAIDLLHGKLMEHCSDLFEVRIFKGPFTDIYTGKESLAKKALKAVKNFELKEESRLEGVFPGICINTENGYVHEFDGSAPKTTQDPSDVLCVLPI